MQPDIRDLCLLADSRTTALLGPDGDIPWMCWPRVDSEPVLRGLVDEDAGGQCTVRPLDGVLRGRQYLSGSLVVESQWQTPTGAVTIHEAMATDSMTPRLLRVVTAVEGRVELALRARGDVVSHVAMTQDWHQQTPPYDGRTIDARVTASPGTAVVLFGDTESASTAARSLATTLADWQQFAATVCNDVPADGVAARVLGPQLAEALVLQSACVLRGLHQRDGGIVAAPTTSIPQWPATSRTWDYRYAWLRDTALAGRAMVRLGMLDDAMQLGAHCGRACAAETPRVLLRVDGSEPPPEQRRDEWTGYRGSRPVRIGNAAAEQFQLDVTGEVVEFAEALHAAGALPDVLAAAVPRLADIAAARWHESDHGIWEARGDAHGYTHSRLLCWIALTTAVRLHDAGAISGDRTGWETTAEAIRATLLREHVAAQGWFQLHDHGGGRDGSLSLIAASGLLDRDDPRVRATLASLRDLSRGGLVDRYEGQLDGMDDACGAFLFPTFWFAQALEHCGEDGTVPFAAACAARTPLGLWSEVADPVTGMPWGNFPQVQSHASFVLCASRDRAQDATGD